jgi:serine/threonine protein kinase
VQHLDFVKKAMEKCDLKKTKFKGAVEKCKSIENVHATTPIAQIVYEKGGRNLNEAIETNSFCTILNGFRSIFAGLVQLQTLRVVHGDIKPANIVFDASEGKAYLVDFGSAYVYEDIKSQYKLMQFTYRYYPPEYKMIYNEQNNTQLPVLKGVEDFKIYIVDIIKLLSNINLPGVDLTTIKAEIFMILNGISKQLPQSYDPKKFDVYALGITLLEIFVYRLEHIQNDAHTRLDDALLDVEFIKVFLRLVESMICRSDTRKTPRAIKRDYDDMLNKYATTYFPVSEHASAKTPDYVIAVHLKNTSPAISTLAALQKRNIDATKIIVFVENDILVDRDKKHTRYKVINLPKITEQIIRLCFSKDTPILLMAGDVTDKDLEKGGDLDSFYKTKAKNELEVHRQNRAKLEFIRPCKESDDESQCDELIDGILE